jgi:hypothetical protein
MGSEKMANTYTTNLLLAKPGYGDTGWDDEINGNFDILDEKTVPYTGATSNVNLGSYNLTTTGTLGAGVGTLSGHNNNAAFTLLNLNNTDNPATTETAQTADLVFNLMGTADSGSTFASHEAAKISAYKVNDWWNSSEADYDSGLKFYTTSNGTPTLRLTISDVGVATFVNAVSAASLTLTTDLAVADGGTGRSVTTAYMPITGGTTTTAAMQSVATGTQYYPLCYNTSASLPTWQILDVRGGGTGRATLTTAYGILTAGTTATGATQTLAAGTAGQYLISGGSAAVPTWTWGVLQSKSSAYTALMTDDVILVSGVTTITLPTAVGCSGKTFAIKNINTTTSTVTVDTNASETIDGALTWTSQMPNESITIISNGSNWRII